MANAIATQSINVPAHILEAMAAAGVEANIETRVTGVDQLTFRGKVWRAVVKGDEHVQSNSDGDPVSTIKVVIMASTANRSRVYYEGQYKEGENRHPTCCSADGKVPDAYIEDPQSNNCTGCQMAAKGSRVNDSGVAGVACATYKNLVVVPATDLNFPLLRLRIPQTSIWDKNVEEKGWYAYDNYIDMLRINGFAHTGHLVTKIKFDPTKAYPKLLFSLDTDHDPKFKAFLTADEAALLAPRFKEDMTLLLGAEPTIRGRTVTAIAAPKPAPSAAKAQESSPKPKADKPATNEALGDLLSDWDDA